MDAEYTMKKTDERLNAFWTTQKNQEATENHIT